MLKEQIQVLIKERNSFKNAFRIQHERFSDYEEKSQELQQLKQLVSQYQEQIRTLEVCIKFIPVLSQSHSSAIEQKISIFNNSHCLFLFIYL